MSKNLIITLEQAIERLGLRIYGANSDSELVPTDVSEINILCPACSHEHTSRRLTLNINYDKQLFRCPRCSFSGNAYHLIARVNGWEYAEVEAKINNGELGKIDLELAKDRPEKQAENVGNPIAPLRQRHEVYSAMLSHLKLNDTHRENLRKRGLSDEAIDRIGFRSYPKFMDPSVLAKKLVSSGYDLRGVPGFCINNTGEWCVSKLPDGGFLIPSRNGQGLIQGFQVRFDHPNAKVPKFGYFTSSGMTGGTKAGSWCSWAGEDIVSKDNKEPFDVLLIEGPLKAYIVHEITGVNLIAVPGVAALKKVPAALQSMLPLGLRTVHIAYDMDQEENEEVARQLNRLREILTGLNIPHQTMYWESEYKGLDDWIVSPAFTD